MKRLVCFAIVIGMSALATNASADDRLIDAVRQQDRAAVQALIKRGGDLNFARPDGATAMHWAAYSDDLQIAQALITAGAKADVLNQLGISPLHLACENGSPQMVALLLKAGASPNKAPEGRETPLMTAARAGNPEVMKLLLAKGGSANATESSAGQTALMWAASEAHPEVVRLLLASGANASARTKVVARGMFPRGANPAAPNASQTGSSGAAPAKAAPAGAPAPLPVAITAIASLGASGNGWTPLLFASRAGDIESARLILKAGANVNELGADNVSPLLLSLQRGFPKVAEFLLENGADPNSNKIGYTALHWAVGTWESELTVRAITTEREGDWYAIAGLKEGKLDVVKALLAHGADPNARIDVTPQRAGGTKNPGVPELVGATPLILAAMAGDVPVMKALVAAGADPKLRTWTEGTILMAAGGFGHVQGEDFVRDADAKAAAEYALELGSPIDDIDTTSNTALHYATYLRHDATAKLLIDRRASLSAKNNFGETPLWTAELVIQFMAGGTWQAIPSSTGELLRKAGAVDVKPDYERTRPAEWPSNWRPKNEEAGAPAAQRAESPK